MFNADGGGGDDAPMSERVLFSVNHPAQVHLFKHAIWELEAAGCETLVASRDKEMTRDLLDAYDIEYVELTAESNGLVELGIELARREVSLYRVARRFDPDVIVARLSPPAVHVSTAIGCRNLVYMDTVLRPRAVRVLYHGLTLPFVDDICAPPGFDFRVPRGRSHQAAFQELSYLHPNRFEPKPDRLRRHGVEPENPYSVVRLAGWDAYHDFGERGLSRGDRDRILDILTSEGDVYITSEGTLPDEYEQYQITVPPHRIHDLLYYADLYIGDSQTMPTEAALLGTPAIRVNSVVGDHDMYNFVELEETYELLFSYSEGEKAVDRAAQIITERRDDEWTRRRERLITDAKDVTAEMIDLIHGRK